MNSDEHPSPRYSRRASISAGALRAAPSPVAVEPQRAESIHAHVVSRGSAVLHLSEHAAYGRIEAARAARKFPPILDAVASGAIHLTAANLIAPRP